jgi:hypothetical protein
VCIALAPRVRKAFAATMGMKELAETLRGLARICIPGCGARTGTPNPMGHGITDPIRVRVGCGAGVDAPNRGVRVMKGFATQLHIASLPLKPRRNGGRADAPCSGREALDAAAPQCGRNAAVGSKY